MGLWPPKSVRSIVIFIFCLFKVCDFAQYNKNAESIESEYQVKGGNKNMKKLIFGSLLILLVGCEVRPTNPSLSNVSEDGCPAEPLTELDEKNIIPVELGSEPVIESEQIRANQSIGYIFEGQAEQRLSYKADNICVWVYTPNNEILTQGELPVDGKYIVQIGILQGVAGFNLEMSLSNPQEQPLSTENATRSSASPMPSNEPDISSTEIPTPTRSSTSAQDNSGSSDTSDVSPNSPTKPSAPSPNSSSVSREQQYDDMADRLFYEKHPELGGRKIQTSETHLVAEWNEIRRCDAVVDVLFYDRHPELGGRKIQRGESALAQEWLSIRDSVAGCN
jgi:hypothetical protein